MNASSLLNRRRRARPGDEMMIGEPCMSLRLGSAAACERDRRQRQRVAGPAGAGVPQATGEEWSTVGRVANAGKRTTRTNLLARRLRTVSADTSGTILMMAGFALPIMVGFVGLATDTVQWMLWQRQFQQVADSGALSAVYAMSAGDNPTTAANESINLDEHIVFLEPPKVTTQTGPGDPQATVQLAGRRALPFSRLFLSEAPIIRASATAALVYSGKFCVVSLEKTSTGVSLNGNAQVSLGCGVASNSRSAKSITAGGSSLLTSTPLSAVGGIPKSANITSEKIRPYSLPQPDPFVALSNPVVPVPCVSNGIVTTRQNQTVDIRPGCYKGGLSLSGQGTVRMAPGVYTIDSGNFSTGSQVTVIGEGVTIILTSSTVALLPDTVGNVDIAAGSNVRLTAPTASATGDAAMYKGVLIYQDRRASTSGTSKINGNTNLFLQGSIYMPRREVLMDGGGSAGTSCLQLVARLVTFVGNSSVANTCPTDSGVKDFVGTVVRLIK